MLHSQWDCAPMSGAQQAGARGVLPCLGLALPPHYVQGWDSKSCLARARTAAGVRPQPAASEPASDGAAEVACMRTRWRSHPSRWPGGEARRAKYSMHDASGARAASPSTLCRRRAPRQEPNVPMMRRRPRGAACILDHSSAVAKGPLNLSPRPPLLNPHTASQRMGDAPSSTGTRHSAELAKSNRSTCKGAKCNQKIGERPPSSGLQPTAPGCKWPTERAAR